MSCSRSWFSRLDCFGGTEKASPSYPRTSSSWDDVVIMWGKQRQGTQTAGLDRHQASNKSWVWTLKLSLGVPKVKAPTAFTLSLRAATNLFPIHFNLRPRLAFIANGEEKRGDQTKQQTALGDAERRELSTLPPPFLRRLCPLDSFIKRHHSVALRGREALLHNCTRWSN